MKKKNKPVILTPRDQPPYLIKFAKSDTITKIHKYYQTQLQIYTRIGWKTQTCRLILWWQVGILKIFQLVYKKQGA